MKLFCLADDAFGVTRNRLSIGLARLQPHVGVPHELCSPRERRIHSTRQRHNVGVRRIGTTIIRLGGLDRAASDIVTELFYLVGQMSGISLQMLARIIERGGEFLPGKILTHVGVTDGSSKRISELARIGIQLRE